METPDNGGKKRSSLKPAILNPVLIVWAALFVCVLLICVNVGIYGDDFAYGCWGRVSLPQFVSRQAEHYSRANGRALVHLLVMLFLRGDTGIILWRVLVNPLMVTGVAALGYSVAFRGERNLYAAVLWASAILLLHIDMTRQSVYWLTGSFNYVLPCLLMFLLWRLLRDGHEKTAPRKILPALAFIASATSEQAAMICLGILAVTIADDILLRKRTVHRLLPISLCCSVAGALTIFLAPAVRFRSAMEMKDFGGGLLDLISVNLPNQGREFLASSHMLPYQTIAIFAGAAYLLRLYVSHRKEKPRALFVCALISALSFFGWFLFMLNRETLLSAPSAEIKAAFIAVAAGAIFSALMAGLYYWKNHADISPFMCVILAYGAQAMMLVVPVNGPRTRLLSAMILVMYAAFILKRLPFLKALAAVGFLLPILMGAPAFAIPSLLYPAVRLIRVRGVGFRISAAALGCASLLLVSLHSYNATRAGYALNADIYNANIHEINTALDNGQNDVIKLKKYPRYAYGWVMPYEAPYYDVYFREFYGIGLNTALEWTD